MRLKHICLCLSCLSICQLYSGGIRISVKTGLNALVFTPDFMTKTSSLMVYEISPIRNPVFGTGIGYMFTEKKQMQFDILYTDTKLGYAYTDGLGWSIQPGGPRYQYGDIRFRTLLLNTRMLYSPLKWLTLHYGFSHAIHLKNTFENSGIGAYSGWTDSSGRSNIKPYQIALSFGLEFKLYKSLSLEISHNRGLSNAIHLENIIGEKQSCKLIYTTLGLNYRIR